MGKIVNQNHNSKVISLFRSCTYIDDEHLWLIGQRLTLLEHLGDVLDSKEKVTAMKSCSKKILKKSTIEFRAPSIVTSINAVTRNVNQQTDFLIRFYLGKFCF